MLVLFTETFEKLAKFVFKIYDYNKDGKINKEDIRIVLSYIPMNLKNKVSKTMVFEKGDFKDRVIQQEEMDSIIDVCFKNKSTMDEKEFINAIENIQSEIFIFVTYFIHKLIINIIH